MIVIIAIDGDDNNSDYDSSNDNDNNNLWNFKVALRNYCQGCEGNCVLLS